jgi:hypothetical protein
MPKRIPADIRAAAALLGALGGAATKGVTSPKKAAAARRNGRLGGRPRKDPHDSGHNSARSPFVQQSRRRRA